VVTARRLRQLAPWAIAAGILYYLFSQVPIAEAWAATRAARLQLFLPAMLVAVLLWFGVDSAAFAFLFSRFNAPLSWAEARALRGVTYLATPVNWNLGTAAVILHLRTSKQIGALESTSTMFFYQTIDGMVLAAFVLLGVSLLPESPEAASRRNIAFGLAAWGCSGPIASRPCATFCLSSCSKASTSPCSSGPTGSGRCPSASSFH
jgi:hypothetical protein